MSGCGYSPSPSPSYPSDEYRYDPPAISPPAKTEKEELDEVLSELYDYYYKTKNGDQDKLSSLLAKYKRLTGKDKPNFAT